MEQLVRMSNRGLMAELAMTCRQYQGSNLRPRGTSAAAAAAATLPMANSTELEVLNKCALSCPVAVTYAKPYDLNPKRPQLACTLSLS